MYQGDKLIHRLTLKPLYAVTDYALLPPRKPLNIPILAVAYLDDKGQPWLYLYNGATGEPFRQLYGHTDLIRAVAFSGDGRLLVSAAADQTVSVWSLTNLEKLVGQRGMVWGVAVREENHHLVAASVDKDGPGQGVLQEGDVIEGLVTNNQLRALATPGDYYDALSLLKPGTQVTLRIQGKKDVQLPLGQALNQRKPLFSLFITRAARAQDREWIGWNPIGPYEASDRKTERLIGWHINTGDPVRPTTFATADQYRKELYREGILRFLAARGDLSPALHDWEQEDSHKKLPEPKRNVWIDEIGPGKVDGKGQILIQHLPVTLKVRIDDFPLDKVASVTWQQVGAGGPQALEAPLGSEWSANLSALPWKRGGLYSIRVLVRTREAVPQEFPNDLLLRYQPPPPVIAWGGAPVAPAGVPLETATPRVTVDQPDYTFQAQVQPGSEGEAVKVRLTHTLHQQKPATYDEGAAIHQKLQLRPGENRIEVVAENQNALAGDEDFETSRFSLLVVYVPREVKKAPPPRIDLAQIVLRPGGSEEVLPIPAGQPVVVHSPRLRIVGRIQAEEPIQKAEWMKEGAREWTRLDGFAAGKTELPINQEVEGLEAKKQTFRFVAQTATSDEAEAVVTLDYRPRLPQLLLIQPALEMTLADEGQGDPPVQLDWQVQTDNEEPFEAVVLLDEKPEANPPAYNKAVGTLTARIAVSGPGDHQVQVQVKNSWETLLTPPFHIRVIRPPLVTYENPAADTKPVTTARALINLNFQVTSVLPLLPETVRLEVNGTERKVAVTLPDRQGEGQTGLLRLQDVPLDPGVNQVQLWVSNAEGECRNPGTAAVVYAPPVQRPAPPEIEILEPRETTVTEDQVLIRGRIKSAVPLKKVEVVREGDHPFRDALNVANLKPNADGYYLFEEQVPLVPQANRIRVAAVNEGGPADAQVAVTYLYFPVRLAIKSLKPHGKEANPVAPIELANGGILVAPMSTGRVQLTGSVLAGKLDAGQLKKVNYVRVFVNGFQQVPAQIQPAEDASQLERPFQAELLLNQPVNRIELELADLKAEAGTRTEFNLTCSQPQAGQRLHYLVMAVGEKDPEQLKKEAFQAIGAVADARGEYHTPAFQEVHLYGPLTGFVRPETVFTQLTIIKKTIDLLAHQGSATDVVLVYYQGDEAITPNGHFFKTSLSKYDPVLERSAITCAGLENYYLETLGAKITWLDVARDLPDQAQPPGELKDQVVRWNEESRSAVWRSSWVKGSSSNLNRRWLLTALDEEVPGKRALGQVAAGVGNLFQTQFPRELSYLMKNPDTYQTLVVGPGS